MSLRRPSVTEWITLGGFCLMLSGWLGGLLAELRLEHHSEGFAVVESTEPIIPKVRWSSDAKTVTTASDSPPSVTTSEEKAQAGKAQEEEAQEGEERSSVVAWVYALDGSPLEGVEVRSRMSYSFPGDPAYREDDLSLEERVTMALGNQAWGRRQELSAVTDAEGRAELLDVPRRYVFFEAIVEGRTTRRNRTGGDRDRGGERTIEFFAARLQPFEIEVTLPDGTRAPEGVLFFRGGGPLWQAGLGGGRHRTSSRGSWRSYSFSDGVETRIAPGRYEVLARVGDEYYCDYQTFVVDDSTPASLVLELRPTGTVVGKVSGTPGFDPAEHRIKMISRPEHGDPQIEYHAETGDFEIRGLPRGEYDLSLSRYNEVVAQQTVTVNDDRVLTTLHSAQEPPLVVTLDVVGVGEPVYFEGRFSIDSEVPGSSSGESGTARRVGRNRFEVELSDDAREALLHPEGELRIAATLPSGQPNEVRISPDNLGPYPLEFAEPGWVEVTLQGFRGSGLETGLRASLVSADGASTGLQMPDRDGVIVLRHLQPGSHELRVAYGKGTRTAGGGRILSGRHLRTLARSTVKVAPGRNRVAVRVPWMHELKVRFFAGKVGEATLERVGTGLPGMVVDIIEGRANFGFLPAAEYELRVGGRSMPISLDKDTVISFDTR